MVKGKSIYRSTPFFWRQLLWKVALIAMLLFLFAQVALIWLMSEQETADAFSSGRRLLVTLETSDIYGKKISSEDYKPEEINQEKTETPEAVPHVEPDKLAPIAETPAENKEPGKEPEPLPEKQKEPPSEIEKEQSKEPQAEAAPAEKDTQLQDQAKAKVAEAITAEEPPEAAQMPAIIPSTTPPAEILKSLIDKTEFGALPKIASDGTKPWKYYSKPLVIKDKKPMISIIVTGVGTNKNTSEQALRLPEAINLSFSVYSKDLHSWMTAARISGHETMLDLPMEASNYPVSDPGPLGLLVSKDQPENETKIKKLMARDAGYVGFLTPQDEAFLGNNELFKSLLQVLSGRGLMLVVGRQPAKNETKDIIEQGNTASIVADTLIDEELSQTGIDARLSLLEQIAKQNGYAVGIARSYPITIKQLNMWADKSEENGFNLVPVSMIISKRY